MKKELRHGDFADFFGLNHSEISGKHAPNP